MAQNSMEHPFGTTTQAWPGGRCGLSPGSPASPGGGHHGRRGFGTERRPAWRAQSGPVTHRNRDWDTGVVKMELRIPKIREGSYFPSLPEPRRRSEKALLTTIQQAYVEGVSTRRVDRPHQVPGLRRHFEKPGIEDLRAAGRGGGELPGSTPGRWPVSLRVVRCDDPQGEGGWPHRERQRGGGHRRQRPGSA